MSTEPNTLFRKRPVVIEAFQLPAAGVDVPDAFHHWCERVGFVNFTSGRDETLEIQTLEGTMTAQPCDWIIKGVKGEFYPCKPDIFAATYELTTTLPNAAAQEAIGQPSGGALAPNLVAAHNAALTAAIEAIRETESRKEAIALIGDLRK
ncbi:hypothetical protein [Variovorax sp. RCC_210]|uniref:hypothetical protein n=1 Tax=Variovorax sp. RCC_210 TaxID=3239217 RepID=UPI003524A3CC